MTLYVQVCGYGLGVIFMLLFNAYRSYKMWRCSSSGLIGFFLQFLTWDDCTFLLKLLCCCCVLRDIVTIHGTEPLRWKHWLLVQMNTEVFVGSRRTNTWWDKPSKRIWSGAEDAGRFLPVLFLPPQLPIFKIFSHQANTTDVESGRPHAHSRCGVTSVKLGLC